MGWGWGRGRADFIGFQHILASLQQKHKLTLDLFFLHLRFHFFKVSTCDFWPGKFSIFRMSAGGGGNSLDAQG